MTENYFELQNAVHEALMQKHSEDESFCFTLRKNYDQNTYLNFFTGTEKSDYFSFSLWYIKTSYPGASIDPIVYRVILRENFLRIELQLLQTKTPEDNQNKLVLQLLQNIYNGLKSSQLRSKYTLVDDIPGNRMFKVIIRPEETITTKENLIQRLLELIADTAPIIDRELNPLRANNIDFDAQRVSKTAFEKMISVRNNRTEKLKNSIPGFREIVAEVININSIETNTPFYFDTIHNTYVWVGDKSGLIGTKRAHYEIQYDERKDHSHVLIHFEDAYATEIKNALGDNLPKHFNWYDWHKGEGIKIGGFEMSKRPETPAILFEKLKEAENLLGDKLREILKTLPTNTLEMKPLNQILYGPPGTGKTYNTIDKVVSICEPEKYLEGNHQENKILFDELIKEGRAVFTTFHQSMAYEDFIEGIKPIISNKEIEDSGESKTLQYQIEDGIFKQISSSATSYNDFEAEKNGEYSIDSKLLEGKNFFKVSLGNTLDDSGDIIYNYCKENSCIAIGWGGDNIDYSGVKDRKEVKERFSVHGYDESEVFHISAIERLAVWMKKGDIVFVSHGNSQLKAVGIIEGDYEHRPSKQLPFSGYNHFRKVKWLILDAHIPVHEVYYAKFSQQSIYMMWSDKVKKEFFTNPSGEKKNKNHVLVIDEINRGNVSAIFGELITLIEADKRLGKDNELTVTLPYSKEKFGIPSNLYIIGTMNTADRSVEALDTALRRRFSFVEMLPQPELLENRTIDGVNLTKLLTTINERIEALVDRDHTIGHAYFMNVDSISSLQNTFAKNIIPLLQEYFYGNYAKMELVIGPDFFKQDTQKKKVIFAVNNSEIYDSDTVKHQLKNILLMEENKFMEAVRRLLDPAYKKVNSPEISEQTINQN